MPEHEAPVIEHWQMINNRFADAVFMGRDWPSRSCEGLFTAVYQYEVRPGWTMQPNFQYVVHPGGGATNPLGTNQPGLALKNAVVLGLRTVLKF